MHSSHVFLVALLGSLIAQGLYWNSFEILDAPYWIQAAEALMNLSHTMFDTFTYGYPGAPPLLGAISVHWLLGIPLREAFYGSLAVIIAFGSAVSAWLCYLIRPHTWWWVGAGVVMATSNLYRNATPPSAAAFPFVIIIILLSLYIYEHRPVAERWPFIVLGGAIGMGAAARLDITLFVAAVQAVFLWLIIGWSAVLFTALVAFLVFCLFNPYMWLFPVHHIMAFVRKLFYHYESMTDVMAPFGTFIKTSPFAWLGLFYGIVFAGWKRTSEFMPRVFVLNVLFLTISLVTILSMATYRPFWYFSPLILLWEILFLLFMIELTSRATYTLGFPRNSLLWLYVAARLSIFILFLLNRHPALLFFA